MLTGRLASGDSIDILGFQQGSPSHSGTIRLSFAPVVPALSTWGYLALVSCLIGFGVVYGRRVVAR